MPDLGPFLISGISTGAIYVLSGVGLVILFQSSGVVNLAQGAVGALSALIAWNIADSGGPQWVGWLAGVVAATAVSLAYGRLVAPRLAYSDPIVRAVATLGFALVILGFLELMWGEWPRALRLPTDAIGFRVLGVRITYTRLIAMGLSLAITGGIIVFFRRSKLGLGMRALANNREIGALLGVPVLQIDAWAWTMSGAIAGVSGILLANMVRLQALILTFLVIPAVAAAIAGRMRSLYATVIGGLLIGIAEATATPFPYVGPVRGLAPFIFAVAALLWLQRRGQSLFSTSSGLGETDQNVYGASAANGRRDLLLRIGMGIGGAVVVAMLIPEIASAYWLKTLTSVVVLALASLCVGVIYAQLGMVSLCQFALVGVGGWFALRLYHATHLPFELSILAGGVSAAIFGLVFGLPALRMRGLYLALTTLMIAGGFQVAISALEFPDGGPGITGKMVSGQRAHMERPFLALSDASYFRYCIAFLVIGYLIVLWHKRSRAGRAWAMIRRSEVCALAAGVNIVRYKVWAFTLAGFLAGVAGALLAGLIGQMDQGAFPASESVLLFALTVIGGAGHWAGPIVAGLLLRAFPALLNDFGINGNVATMIFGVGLLHALVTAPQGVSGQLVDLSPPNQGEGRSALGEETSVIEIEGLVVTFGGVSAVSNLTATLDAPVTGLIGPNGAGKTTLLNVLSGFVQPAQGTVKVDGIDILNIATYRRSAFGIRRTFQTEQVVLNLSVWDNVAAILDHVLHAERSRDQIIHAALAYVGLQDRPHRQGGELSASDRRMVEIARGIVGSPRLILMDEPGAGLSEVEADHLRRVIVGIPEHCGAQVLLVDHDVDLISHTCSATLVLDFGVKIAYGRTEEVLKDPAVRTAYLGEAA